jgi:hypothetical protein
MCCKSRKAKGYTLSITQIIFSIDLLRLISPTVEFPDFEIFYDADFRNAHQVNSKILIQPIQEEEHFSVEYFRKAIPFVINKMAWDVLIQSGLSLLHQFAKKTTSNKSELEALIHNAIHNFSKAIANHDLHERVVQMFTVLESLLLPNDNSAIVDSVCKYLPKIITQDLEERKTAIETVKEMYKIRSAMVHHAKRKEFELKNLTIVGICTRTLIFRLIQLSASKKT